MARQSHELRNSNDREIDLKEARDDLRQKGAALTRAYGEERTAEVAFRKEERGVRGKSEDLYPASYYRARKRFFDARSKRVAAANECSYARSHCRRTARRAADNRSSQAAYAVQ